MGKFFLKYFMNETVDYKINTVNINLPGNNKC